MHNPVVRRGVLLTMVAIFVACTATATAPRAPKPTPLTAVAGDAQPASAATATTAVRSAPTVTSFPRPTSVPVTRTLILPVDGGLVRIDKDGSVVPLTLPGLLTDWTISPDNRWLAVETRSGRAPGSQITLRVLMLPSGETVKSIDLLSPTAKTGGSAESAVSNSLLAWSPDSAGLAFIGAQDSSSSDLYVISIADGAVHHLTEDSEQAISPIWSPDSQRIAFQTVQDIDNPDASAALAVASVDGSQTRVVLEATLGSAGVAPVSWLSTSQLTVESYAEAGQSELKVVDVDSGDTHMIYKDQYRDILMSPRNDKVVVYSSTLDGSSPVESVALVSIDDGSAKPLYSKRIPNGGYEALAGWTPAEKLLVYTVQFVGTPGGAQSAQNVQESNRDLRVIDPKFGKTRSILYGTFERAAIDPASGIVMVLTSKGSFLIDTAAPETRDASVPPPDKCFAGQIDEGLTELHWSQPDQRFIGRMCNRVFAVGVDNKPVFVDGQAKG